MAVGVRLVRAGLSNRVFVVTRWRDDPKRGPEAFVALEKFDVTEEFNMLTSDTLLTWIDKGFGWMDSQQIDLCRQALLAASDA